MAAGAAVEPRGVRRQGISRAPPCSCAGSSVDEEEGEGRGGRGGSSHSLEGLF